MQIAEVLELKNSVLPSWYDFHVSIVGLISKDAMPTEVHLQCSYGLNVVDLQDSMSNFSHLYQNWHSFSQYFLTYSI